MKITIEQVEKLQKRANVSYAEAKDALEKCDGDILEAIIMLEQEGMTKPAGNGAYSTNGQNTDQGQTNNNSGNSEGQYYGQQNSNNQQGPQMNYNNQQQQGSNFGKQMDGLWKSICRLFHKGNINHFVITKNYEEIVRLPVNILILLLIVFSAAAVILLIVLLFFGFRYSFTGPDLGKQSINKVMDAASNTAEDIKDSTMNAAADNNNDQNNKQ